MNINPKLILCLALVLGGGFCHVRADDTDEPDTTNLQDLALNIYCTNVVLKLGDEIPVEFVISNHGTTDFAYEDRDYDRSGRMPEYQLTVKSADGKTIPDPRANYPAGMGGGLSSTSVLHPGESFTKTIPLNLWAILQRPGQYSVTGTYLGSDEFPCEPASGIQSDPIRITILPRTESEMHAYISDLTNQITANQDAILMKLAFTCDPKVVPFMLNEMYNSRYNFWEAEALVVYVPHSDSIRTQVVETALKRGLADSMDYMLNQYHCTDEEWRHIIERSLAKDNPHSWAAGALAAQNHPDDAFMPRLIAIATEGTNDISKFPAIFALSMNRTDASVQALKSLLNDTNEEIRSMTEDAIRDAYLPNGSSKGKPFRSGDFEKNLQDSDFSSMAETNSPHRPNALLPPYSAEESNAVARAVEALDRIKNGRPVSRNYQDPFEAADLVVRGTVVKVADLDETNVLKINGVMRNVRAVETTFKISGVVKGKFAGNQIVLHHYRFQDEVPPNSPGLVSFTPGSFVVYQQKLLPRGLVSFTPNNTNEFRLCLARDGTNGFVPASGQRDPSLSIMALSPPWDLSYFHQADPAIRENYQIRLPTKLMARWMKGMLQIHCDPNLLAWNNLTIGTNMMVGIWCDLYVYAAGTPRPINCCHDLEPDIGAFMPNVSEGNKLDFDWTYYYWRPDGNGVAVPSPLSLSHQEGVAVVGTKYNVEMDLTLFETDSTKVARFWNPQKARYYKVLWQRTIKQVVE